MYPIDKIIDSLDRVSTFDIYRHDVLLQTVYTRKLETTVLFLPVEEKNAPQDWRVQYLFKDKQTEPVVEVTGKLRKARLGSSGPSNTGKAVAKVIAHHSLKETTFRDFPYPLLIRASWYNPRYVVSLIGIPEVIHGRRWGYISSGDFTVFKRFL